MSTDSQRFTMEYIDVHNTKCNSCNKSPSLLPHVYQESKCLFLCNLLFYCSDKSDSRCYMTQSHCLNSVVRAQSPPTNKLSGLWTQSAGILDILSFVTKIDHSTLPLTFVFDCCFQPYNFHSQEPSYFWYCSTLYNNQFLSWPDLRTTGN